MKSYMRTTIKMIVNGLVNVLTWLLTLLRSDISTSHSQQSIDVPTPTDEFCELIQKIKANHSHLRIVQIIHNALMDREAYYMDDPILIEKLRLYEHNLGLEKELDEVEEDQ